MKQVNGKEKLRTREREGEEGRRGKGGGGGGNKCSDKKKVGKEKKRRKSMYFVETLEQKLEGGIIGEREDESRREE